MTDEQLAKHLIAKHEATDKIVNQIIEYAGKDEAQEILETTHKGLHSHSADHLLNDLSI